MFEQVFDETAERAARRYAEPVEVRRRDDAPAQFLWRGRLHLVQAVLAHWVEAGRWWRTDLEGSAGPVGLDDGEREIWRVEAGAGRNAAPGVFDLCFDWATGGWVLARVHD